ncbi:MAG: hypothetical protein AAAB16_04190 [Pseudomonas sp.]
MSKDDSLDLCSIPTFAEMSGINVCETLRLQSLILKLTPMIDG